METLFALAPVLPLGFQYEEDFLSKEEEKILLDAVKNVEVHPMLFQGYEAKRKV